MLGRVFNNEDIESGGIARRLASQSVILIPFSLNNGAYDV